jgi:EAL domain-containing protein (putative c-di-GMP-specific phosphodiesterase class I)
MLMELGVEMLQGYYFGMPETDRSKFDYSNDGKA